MDENKIFDVDGNEIDIPDELLDGKGVEEEDE